MVHDQGLSKEEAVKGASQLLRFVRSLDKDSGEYESLMPSTWPPLQLVEGSEAPSKCIYVTKLSLFTRWGSQDLLPPDWIVLCRYGLPTPRYQSRIQRLRQGLPILFVGDLDPLDLHVFFSMKRGDLSLRGSERSWLIFAGINDSWLDLCDRNLKPGRKLESMLIPMSELEKAHFDLLFNAVPGLPGLIGERSFELLRTGWKLELEGATNAAHYRERHLASVVKKLAKLVPR